MNTNHDMLQESVIFPHLDQETGENDCSEDSEMCEDDDCDNEPMDSFDGSDDENALASAGHGEDESYGCFGGDE